MKRLLALTVLTIVTAGASGCNCCGPLARFEAWKMHTFFGAPDYGPQCCEPAVDYCEPCNTCDPCGGTQTYSAPGTIVPGPVSDAPAL